MPALTDLPELIGFFSYSRDDDRDSEGGLTLLTRRIQSELRGQLGRSKKTLRLFQDAEAIPPGTLWEGEISGAIEQSAFFIPIISPRVVQSEHCGVEFRKFLDREKALGRTDLIFPILYIDVPELHEDHVWRNHPTLNVIGNRLRVVFDRKDNTVRREALAVPDQFWGSGGGQNIFSRLFGFTASQPDTRHRTTAARAH